ncbi:MAG: threonine/serine exporter family protein [Tissierellales bacterium]|nr:threonine/serine exporter family protein [Tissierellales bacterium]MBN2826396.1 threonine/serine exporter family protein [Tissierellales bacterium]
MEKKQVKRIIKLALHAGIMLLENGAETYRVEDTINKICLRKGIISVQSFVIPTGIFISIEDDDENYSLIHRTRIKRIDLEVISRVNDFSRKFTSNVMSIDEGEKELLKIQNAPSFSKWQTILAGAIGGGFFTLLFNGGVVELVLAFINSLFVILFTTIAVHYQLSFFVKNLIGGMVNMILALILSFVMGLIGINANIDIIIIGSLMPLVPGVAIVNAIRDIISGDFVSGTSRFTEAILIAVALALGVGSVLQIYILVFGGGA